MRIGLAWPLTRRGRPGEATLGQAVEAGWDAFFLDARGVPPREGPALSPLFEAAAMLGAATGGAGGLGFGLCSAMPVDLHPLRLAEELGALDLMAEGRFEWVLDAPPGSGDRGAGGDLELGERLEILLQAFEGRPFAHQGQRYAFGELQVVPAPMGSHAPRIWLADTLAGLRDADRPALGRIGRGEPAELEGAGARALEVACAVDDVAALGAVRERAEARGIALLLVHLEGAGDAQSERAARALGLG